MKNIKTLDDVDVAGKRVLLRLDLNVPVRDGKITDVTRIERARPTIAELARKGARVIVLSHFDRPKGKRVPEMSLRPLSTAMRDVLGLDVFFADDCVGPIAEEAVANLEPGQVLLLENTRFHQGEEENDDGLARQLASLADLYVNDAFSAAHRAHASTAGVAAHLPSHAGRLMQREVEALTAALEDPERPVCAIVGGSKISTKLELLGNLVEKVDMLVIGGAMANTFLAAQGTDVGRSLQERDMHATARDILAIARAEDCEIVLPVDAVTATEFRANPPVRVVPIGEVPADAMILDVGPKTVELLIARLPGFRTLVWNGPLGAFETPPFDAATVALAHAVADATAAGALRSVAGGGDTVAALRHAGVLDRMSYVSTAGGAFLEWLEGKILPGILALDAVSGVVMPAV
jgi:phosphoglycerate kinase